ncbi:MAG: carbonic anhydrase, partial [Phycisphaerae bacterium]|nr:carbonic anhydrase [Phycisphaerae bacterium]
ASAPAKAEAIPADVALRRLIAGNRRFVRDIDDITRRDITRRSALAAGERPFAIVLCGSDSRVPPELVFDTDLGDLFVVRIVGNFADDITVGSIEYAVEHLGAKLIVVMGHRCGAVNAAVKTARIGRSASDLPGHFGAVIAPLMTSARETAAQPGDPSRNLLVRSVQRTVLALRTSDPTIGRFVASQGVRVVGAVYDLETGAVDFVQDAYERTPPAATSEIAQQR